MCNILIACILNYQNIIIFDQHMQFLFDYIIFLYILSIYSNSSLTLFSFDYIININSILNTPDRIGDLHTANYDNINELSLLFSNSL